jgi:hypothetical protein
MENVRRETKRKYTTLRNAKADGRIKLKYSFLINKESVLWWTV